MSDLPTAAQAEVSKLRSDFAALKADTLKRFRAIDQRIEEVVGNHNDLDDQSDERHDAVQKWQAESDKRMSIVENAVDQLVAGQTRGNLVMERVDRRLLAVMAHLKVDEPEPIPDPDATP